ncbi:acyl transferase/acyl hydrolase/lysophospholipase [Mycena epipterygia]|nr:acyl transferase/acyl hydrolase/lysophospholipase [Mycena epipterygia]
MMYCIRVEGHLDTDPSPCDCFELIGGSGTGGIIALMLGRLRMSVKDAISAYGTLCPETKMGSAKKFKTRSFEEALKKIFKQELMNNMKPNACKTFVCAMNQHNMNARIPHLFRSYNTPDEPASTCMIWEAARATSATPELLKPMEIGQAGMIQHYIDGGVGNNNPTSLVIEEARILFPSEPTVLVCSIGSGHPDTIQIPTRKSNTIAKVMKNIATDCEHTHENNAHKFHMIPNTYFRFNVQQGMQALEAKDWNKLPEVSAHTDAYLRTRDTKTKLTDAVKVILSMFELLNMLPIELKLLPDPYVSGPKIAENTNNCPPPSRIFEGRRAILDGMHQYFFQATGKQHIYLLYGLGGAGKTQIALKFIEESSSQILFCSFSNTFFIDTSTVETIDTGLKNIALANNVGSTSQDALQWLRNKPDEWLLFFDNADDPKLNLNKFLPQCNHGNILITSRNPALCVYARSHSLVSDMEEEEAMDLLLKSAAQEITPDNRKTAAEIVKVSVVNIH